MCVINGSINHRITRISFPTRHWLWPGSGHGHREHLLRHVNGPNTALLRGLLLPNPAVELLPGGMGTGMPGLGSGGSQRDLQFG